MSVCGTATIHHQIKKPHWFTPVGFFHGLLGFVAQANQGRLVIGIDGKEAAHAVHIKRTVGRKSHAPLGKSAFVCGAAHEQLDVLMARIALDGLPQQLDAVGRPLHALGELTIHKEQVPGDLQLDISVLRIREQFEKRQGAKLLCGRGLVKNALKHAQNNSIGF